MHTRRESLIPQNSDYSQTNQFWTRKKITTKKTHVFRANLPKLSIKVKIDFHSSLFPTMVTHVRHQGEKSHDSGKIHTQGISQIHLPILIIMVILIFWYS